MLKETQSSYQVVSNDESENILKEFSIDQNNNNGIDTEDRIEKMKKCLEEYKQQEINL